MLPVTEKNLSGFGPDVATPAYDRSRLRAGIAHIGVGGFHRAHQAMYLDRLMNQGQALDWAVCGVGVLPSDRRIADVMAAQDCLYTLVVKHPDGTLEPRIIGSLVEYRFAPDAPGMVVDRLADPAIRIVTLTVTEGGYNFDPVTGRFGDDDEAVRHDVRVPGAPRTVFGLVVEALVRRRERGIPPFAVVSCDNIQGNGDVARRSFSAFAALRDPELGDWISRTVRFPNSMVDRITPLTTDDDRDVLAERFGVQDAWPVVCEPFAQWVLQDTLDERPPLQDAGAQLVDEVWPHELMKLRLLNASHQAMSYFGYLAGHRFVDEACTDSLIARFLQAYMDGEATPTLAPVPGIDLQEYKRTLLARFRNPHVRDTLARNATDASDRIPKFLLPVIRDNLRQGGPVGLSAAVVASWARYAEGVDEEGQRIDVVDRAGDRLVAAARRQRQDPLAFLRDRDIFGDLVDDDRFTTAYVQALTSLHRRGARATLQDLLG